MYLMCIDNEESLYSHLTIGKVYESLPESRYTQKYGSAISSSNCYFIENDLGFVSHYLKSRFRNLSHIRNKKLKQLGI